ncbi:MAG: DUF1064 domain-containing protein [Lachnospiraceae bacterium]|nr:DUF1064 domain-containing protein [Lachnospiraceae bacterium]
MRKYHNQKTNGFDSRKEALRYQQLCLMQSAGVIQNLECQVPFTLIPAQKDETGKVIERAVKYIADFVYFDNELGERVVEDVKGVKTKEYIIKRKLLLHKYGIRIKET